MKKIIILSLILLFLSCVKKEADGKEFCEKNCKSACEMAGGDIDSCMNNCVGPCENAGPNPFYKK
jgi:hypothetical protein